MTSEEFIIRFLTSVSFDTVKPRFDSERFVSYWFEVEAFLTEKEEANIDFIFTARSSPTAY